LASTTGLRRDPARNPNRRRQQAVNDYQGTEEGNASGGTITATFANSITAEAMSVREFTVGTNNTLQLATVFSNAEFPDAADWGSLSIISLDSKDTCLSAPSAMRGTRWER
jgi:hypothetical protein